MHSELILRGMLVSLMIFVSIILLSYFHLGSDWEIRLAESLLPLVEGSPQRAVPVPDYGIRSIMFTIGDDNDARTRMQQIIAIVRELKKRGVKAVFVPVPEMLNTDSNKKLIRELSELEIPILWTNLHQIARYQKTLWVMPPLKNTEVRWGVNTSRIEEVIPLAGRLFPTHQIVRFRPNSVRDNVQGNPVEDIVLQSIRIIKGYPDSLEIVPEAASVTVRDVEIPIDSDGSALVRTLHPFLRKDPTQVSVTYGLDGGKNLSFDGVSKRDDSYIAGSDMSQMHEDLHNKIVIVTVRHFSDPLNNENYRGFLAGTIESVLAGHTLRRMREWTMLIVLLALVSSVAVCLLFRSVGALFLNMLGALFIIALHLYFYGNGHLVFEIQYALIAMAMSSGLIPALRLSWEIKVLKQGMAGISQQ